MKKTRNIVLGSLFSSVIYMLLTWIFGRWGMHCICAYGRYEWECLWIFSAIAAIGGIFLIQKLSHFISLGPNILIFIQSLGMIIAMVFWHIIALLFEGKGLFGETDFPRERNDFIMYVFCACVLGFTIGCSVLWRLIQLFRDRKKKLKEQ